MDSCHGTIRYQAVEGLVTNGRTMKNVVIRKQGHPHVPPHYSSLENLLTTEGTSSTSNLTNILKHRRPHYGSTESLSSLGSQRNLDLHHKSEGEKPNPSRMTQTPTSLYSQDSSTLNVSRESNETNITTTDEDVTADDVSKILYDIPGMNCIKTGLPGKLILSKRKGLRENSYSLENSL